MHPPSRFAKYWYAFRSPPSEARPGRKRLAAGFNHAVGVELRRCRAGVVRQNAQARSNRKIRQSGVASRSDRDDAVFLIDLRYDEIGKRNALDIANKTIPLIHRLSLCAAVARQRHPSGIDYDAARSRFAADDRGEDGDGDIVKGADSNASAAAPRAS